MQTLQGKYEPEARRKRANFPMQIINFAASISHDQDQLHQDSRQCCKHFRDLSESGSAQTLINPDNGLKDISPQLKDQSLNCVSEIVDMTDLRSECRDVMGHPRETATVLFGLGLAAALNSSSQAQKDSFPDQGRTAFTPATGL